MLDAVRALAFVGDLSMGQPVDHSTRTAWLARRLAVEWARTRGIGGAEAPDHAACVALLRWSGCTANAPEFAALLGDDVGGRDAMLTTASAAEAAAFAGSVGELARIHCEVSGEIACVLGLPAEVERALRDIFETHDGQGKPAGLSAEAIPAAVYHVALAGDLEIFTRAHGLEAALRQIGERADARYPAAMAAMIRRHGADWLAALDDGAHEREDESEARWRLATLETPLELVADVIDLKLPWMTGFSRRVARAAREAAAALELDTATQEQVYRAALIHGIGRASVPNTLWDPGRRLGEADRERLRLVPYWTGRAGRRLSTLADEAELASFVDERLDGSGAFRGARAASLGLPARLLAAAAHAMDLMTARPGRPALSAGAACERLRSEVAAGRHDAAAVAALALDGGRPVPEALPAPAGGSLLSAREAGNTLLSAREASNTLLSAREAEVLARIAVGESNKEAARTLGISPSTVRTHLESAFRKLGCSTRAAATLKASTLGLLPA
ncbi:MAG TPA: HD domain-containing phosphohydrolase [Ideonella sp.]|nr:HD domain-containing phosphohydrolase [Ideonella sp.]